MLFVQIVLLIDIYNSVYLVKSRSDLKILVIIPAYNEQVSISMVVKSVNQSLPEADIVVINDGSKDSTLSVAAGSGAKVISLPYNLGIGAAVQTGFMIAHNGKYDVAVQVDGDGQHDPQEIGVLLDHLLNSDSDVVIGSRYLINLGYVTPIARLLGIRILAKYISILCKKRLTDTTSGFRASNRRAIQVCASSYPSDYPEPESLVTFNKIGINTSEVPVSMNQRYGGKSSITPFWSAYYMIKVILAVTILSLRRAPNLEDKTNDF